MNVDSSSIHNPKKATPQCRLWSVIEQLPGLAALTIEWHMQLGDEVNFVKPLLRPRAVLSGSYPRPDGDPYRLPYAVVEHGPDDHVAVCPDTGDSIAITREARIVYEIDRYLLALRVANALGIEVDGAASMVEGALYLGNYRFAQHESFAAFLTIPFETATLEETVKSLVAMNHAPFILLIPTSRFVRPPIESVIRGNQSVLITLADLLYITSKGHFNATQNLDAVIRANMVGRKKIADGEMSQFQKQGKRWILSFAGKTIEPNDSVGLRYIAHLISQKRRNVHAAMLLASASGNKMLKQVRGNELLDKDAQKAIGERYDDLQFRLEEAERNQDGAAQEAIQIEINKLSRELTVAKGFGGRSRRVGDEAEKARKSVSNAITRALNHLENEHPPLARHLDNSIQKGQFLVYSPEIDIDWAM